MISSNLNIEEFLNAVEGGDYMDILLLAELEATAAERLVIQNKLNSEYCKEYAYSLKEFICFLRYGIRAPDVNDYCWQVFLVACENVAEVMNVPLRCYGCFSKYKTSLTQNFS